MVNGEKPKTEAQIKEYMKELTAKSNHVQQLDSELISIHEQIKTLSNTEQSLQAELSTLQSHIEKIEEEKGVKGHTDIAAALITVFILILFSFNFFFNLFFCI